LLQRRVVAFFEQR